MTPSKKQKARELQLIAHRAFRVETTECITRRCGIEMALRLDHQMPICFDIQVEPIIAKWFGDPFILKIRFLLHIN